MTLLEVSKVVATTLNAINIERQDYKARGSYVATVAGVHGIARLFYRRETPDIIVAERTETSEQLQSLGVGHALVQRMVEDARRENVKIYALCTYVAEERRNHPEWADVFYVPPINDSGDQP